MTKKKYFLTVLILGCLTALSPFSIDMYLPGFPDIAKSLNTTTAQVALSLSSYFIGLAGGQLLYGPLLDRFGRKPPLYIGLAVYIAASIGCFMAADINTLIILRFVQAVGGCAAGVASMTMVRDLFPVEENAKVFALLILVLGASPMVAPTVGGYVTAAFNWHLIFVILGLMAVLLIPAVIWLPDTYQPNVNYSLKPSPIINSFWGVAKTPQFITYALAGALSFMGLFVYVSGSPMVFMEIFKVGAKTYGWIFAGLSIGFIGASQVNNILLKKFTSEQIARTALTVQVISSTVFFIGSYYGIFGLAGTIAMVFIMLCCVGTTNPNASALSLAPFATNAGTASSLLGALQLGLGSFSTMLISYFNSPTTVPMSGIMAASAIMALVVLLVGRRFIKHQVKATGTVVGGH
ncbi:multidrug effflux MFS transporter [Mucilaginibacter auburnensis]|uniref:DHA1 family bicyclomycin/chloramphenicol resistance-like MFS transporter n=1 Tax=Mucilaginibacter auburnensis TaxID=1457233 RepID=A0A2H9VUV0_9SPHI|nr:multidrug effflux MFS transporter [Mucilaginibacter auburnensis]PJJ84596.1 DHA1 family bicyclomycin/chloramphenicol resistance-like MFS transporter [Mucilaginibacter auburnensis]